MQKRGGRASRSKLALFGNDAVRRAALTTSCTTDFYITYHICPRRQTAKEGSLLIMLRRLRESNYHRITFGRMGPPRTPAAFQQCLLCANPFGLYALTSSIPDQILALASHPPSPLLLSHPGPNHTNARPISFQIRCACNHSPLLSPLRIWGLPQVT